MRRRNKRKHVKGNASWVGYIDWELESFHGDDYSIMKGWTNDNRMMITCCNDGTRPVIFKIERIDIPETPEEEELLFEDAFYTGKGADPFAPAPAKIPETGEQKSSNNDAKSGYEQPALPAFIGCF